MSTKAQIGNGIALSMSNTSGGTYTAVAEILDCKPPQYKMETPKVYRSDNSSAVVEKIVGWAENSDIELKLTYAAAQRTTLDGLRGTYQYFKITFPKQAGQSTIGDVISGYGIVSELGDETPLKDSMTSMMKIAVSGAVTFAAGS